MNQRPPGYEHVSFVSGHLFSPTCKTETPVKSRFCYRLLSARASWYSLAFPPISPRLLRIAVFDSPLAGFAGYSKKRQSRGAPAQALRAFAKARALLAAPPSHCGNAPMRESARSPRPRRRTPRALFSSTWSSPRDLYFSILCMVIIVYFSNHEYP